jgi:hypothetical protein
LEFLPSKHTVINILKNSGLTNKSKTMNMSDNNLSNTIGNYASMMSFNKSLHETGIPRFNSSSSLQNSTQSWTIPKDERFKNSYKKPATDSIYTTRENKNLRSTTMGLGQRKLFNIINSPSPSNYNIKSFLESDIKHKKGVVIGEKILYKVT